MQEKTINFLTNAVNILPRNNPVTPHLISHYITKCRNIQSKKQVTLSNSSFGPQKLCKKCGNPWGSGKKIRIKERKHLKHNSKRLLKCKTEPDTKLGNLKQFLYKKQFNHLVLICNICNYKYVQDLNFENEPKVPTVPAPTGKVTKRKKKKDIFSGLNVNAVLSAQQNKPVIPLQSNTLVKAKNLNEVVQKKKQAVKETLKEAQLRRDITRNIIPKIVAPKIKKNPNKNNDALAQMLTKKFGSEKLTSFFNTAPT